ncbi:MAG TPA: dienelactone hydrolase family protein, partial [Clostridia bacterium]|nr:dienelactone hydrolase family protein [Clostridia bacterium]
MLGIITLLIALSAQIGFLVYQMVTKNRQTKVKNIIRIAAFAIFSLLLITGVYWWGFRWMGLFILLTVLAILSTIYFIRRPKAEKEYRGLTATLSCVNGCILLTFCILPGILFPQFKEVAPTGSYTVETASYTYIDASRAELLPETGENRKLTVQFWYPAVAEGSEKFPLVVFSHGSFGYRGSNLSTFEDLASNGYVVCSIDHSYQAFFSRHTDGSTTLVNMDFLNDAVNIENGVYDEQRTYDLTHEWMELRTADMHFVLDEILRNTDKDNPEHVYSLIDTEKIGLTGHSLGGATAAQLGRERSDVDAVIVIDGTMIGEELGFENGQAILNAEPYAGNEELLNQVWLNLLDN